MNYKDFKSHLSRFGFAPNGKSPDMWGFSNYGDKGFYDVVIYLDENGLPFEFRLDFSCGKTEDIDETFESLGKN